ncbi:hypothetical protein IWW50_002149 [Coemansia erecta]|nr:hypothetical protein GGF43_002536 [Coemansia sp. RSA 2618]KAJ2826898.1 hypothetical protein IWW50_002149 [Coemansia erecta]
MYVCKTVRQTSQLTSYVREICNTLDARKYSSNANREDNKTTGTSRHAEFAERFASVVRAAKAAPLKRQPADPAADAADKDLARLLTKLFAKRHIDETPELLERRKQLRAKYPEIFKDISL